MGGMHFLTATSTISGEREDSVREMRDEESVDDEECVEAERDGETQATHGTGVIYVDDSDVSI